MREILYFRLGDQDEITLGDLVRAFNQITRILADMDAAVSKDARGTVVWKVEVLQKASPPLIGVVGEPRVRKHARPIDNVQRVESELIKSVSQLSREMQRAPSMSDAALLRVRNLATQSRRIGPIQVYTNKTTAPIDETTLDNIKKLTGTKHKSEGAVIGQLDTIAVHHDNEIRVWDEDTGKPVRCKFPSAMEEDVKAALRKRVLVSGTVSYNPFGQPVLVLAESIDPVPTESSLPTIEQMSGLLDSPTGALSLKEYLARLRDDQ